jgi:hypothetical protein
MAGLDNIKGYDDGGGVEVTESKSGNPQIQGSTYLDPTETGSILQNMQKIIDERQSMSRGIGNALAYGVAAAHGPEAQMAFRRNEEAEQKDTMNMANQMAMYKAALAQQQAQNASFLNQGAGAGQQGGAGGQGAGQQGGTGAGGLVPQGATADEANTINRLVAMGGAGIGQARDLVNSIIKRNAGFENKAQFDAVSNTQQQYKMPDGSIQDLTPNQYRIAISRGVRPQPVQSQQPSEGGTVPAAGGVTNFGNLRPTGSSTGFQQFKTPEEGLSAMDKNLQAYGKMGVNTLSGIINRWAPPSDNNDTQAYIKDVASRLGIKDPNQPLDLSNAMVRQALGTAIALHEHGPQVIFGSTQQVAKPAVATEPVPDPKAFATKEQYNAALDAWKTRQAKSAEGLGTSSSGLSKEDTDIRNEFASDLKGGKESYETLQKLKRDTTGKTKIFNLAGQGIVGPIESAFLSEHVDPKDATHTITKNDQLARWNLKDKDQTDYNLAKQGAAEAQAQWARNLIKGAGGRLTNADIALGGIAKGVGPDQTYSSHMQNLAKQMEAAKVVQLRAEAYDEWNKKNPNAPVSDFMRSAEYEDAKSKARQEVGREFVDIPEANYTHKDKNGRMYVIKPNGKGEYIE